MAVLKIAVFREAELACSEWHFLIFAPFSVRCGPLRHAAQDDGSTAGQEHPRPSNKTCEHRTRACCSPLPTETQFRVFVGNGPPISSWILIDRSPGTNIRSYPPLSRTPPRRCVGR